MRRAVLPQAPAEMQSSARSGNCIFFVIFADMKHWLLTFAFVACVSGLSAQEEIFPSPDAKSLGLGGLSMTVTGTSHTLYHNAAMAAFSLSPIQLSSSFYKQGEGNFYAVSGAGQFGRDNTLQIGWRQYLRAKGDTDMAVDLGYTRRIGNEWGVAVVGRYLHSKHPGSAANALAADLSAAWAHPLEDIGKYATLRAGAKIANLGGYFHAKGAALPVTAAARAALDTFLNEAHELTVGADLGYCCTPSAMRGFTGSVGAEYNLMQLLQIRAGYHYSERTAGYPSYTSVGAGVRFLHLRLDFAYLFAKKSSLLHDTYTFSFGFDF